MAYYDGRMNAVAHDGAPVLKALKVDSCSVAHP
jgi:hypothetical protein